MPFCYRPRERFSAAVAPGPADDGRRPKSLSRRQQLPQLERYRREFLLGETMSINKLFAVLHCQPRTRNRLRGEARNGRRAIYVDRSRRPDGDLRDKPGCVPASGCTKGAPWRAPRCIGPDGSPVGGAQQRRLSPYLVSQEEKPSKSARGAGPPGTRKTRRGLR